MKQGVKQKLMVLLSLLTVCAMVVPVTTAKYMTQTVFPFTVITDPFRSVFFRYTGKSESFTAEAGGYYIIQTWGAGGGNSMSRDGNGNNIGGNGAYVIGYVHLDTGAPLTVNVGGKGGDVTSRKTKGKGGWNGGADGSYDAEFFWNTYYAGAGGGGATDVRRGGTGYNYRIIVAGGGGGAGGHESYGPSAGGSATADNMKQTDTGWYASGGAGAGRGGSGGTSSGGGSGSSGWGITGNGKSGSLGNGGSGGGNGGGGGGGYYGGGGGGAFGGSNPPGGGGAGSSFISIASGSMISGTVLGTLPTVEIPETLPSDKPYQNGYGYCIITYVGQNEPVQAKGPVRLEPAPAAGENQEPDPGVQKEEPDTDQPLTKEENSSETESQTEPPEQFPGLPPEIEDGTNRESGEEAESNEAGNQPDFPETDHNGTISSPEDTSPSNEEIRLE